MDHEDIRETGFALCEGCTAPGRCARMAKCLQLPPGMEAMLDDIFGVRRPGISGPLTSIASSDPTG